MKDSKNLVPKSSISTVKKKLCGCRNPIFTGPFCYNCRGISRNFANNKNVRTQPDLGKTASFDEHISTDSGFNNKYSLIVNNGMTSVPVDKHIDRDSKVINEKVDRKLGILEEKHETALLQTKYIFISPSLIETTVKVHKDINEIHPCNHDNIINPLNMLILTKIL